MSIASSDSQARPLDCRKKNRLVGGSEVTPLRLDDVDHKILARLLDNGRTSFAALGQQIGLSTAATKRRVDRLVRDGAIRRFTAELEPAVLGWSIEAFVELYCEGRVPPDRMRDMVRTIPEVVEAYTATGESDGLCGSGRPTLPTSRRSSVRSATRPESAAPARPSSCPVSELPRHHHRRTAGAG